MKLETSEERAERYERALRLTLQTASEARRSSKIASEVLRITTDALTGKEARS